jgi:hypothetical protein
MELEKEKQIGEVTPKKTQKIFNEGRNECCIGRNCRDFNLFKNHGKRK